MAHWLATLSLEREEHNLSFSLSNRGILKTPIEHIEERNKGIKVQTSIRLTSLMCLCFTKYLDSHFLTDEFQE